MPHRNDSSSLRPFSSCKALNSFSSSSSLGRTFCANVKDTKKKSNNDVDGFISTNEVIQGLDEILGLVGSLGVKSLFPNPFKRNFISISV